ncbi:MAG: ATPase, partial [Coriobacteriaceae bacterium]|nr:ATPase [Coriobacteriaceae bacterium]
IATAVFAVEAYQAWREAAAGETAALTQAALIAISLAVAAIPEGLPAVVTMALSIGVRRMAQRNAIVRRLHAVETLGSTTFICSDKTGTITRNEMRVRRIVVGEDTADILPDFALSPDGAVPIGEDLDLMFEIAASCNDARFAADDTLVGDPTETALIEAADRLSEHGVRPKRVGEVPFDSERKRMTTVHASGGGRVAYMKGGADVVLALCSCALLRGETVPMTEGLRTRLSEVNAGLASSGYRTLALAMRTLSTDEPSEGEDLERDMTYVGIVALLDPPRAGVAEAIDECHSAGIHVAMITGDHALTAQAIGSEIGLVEGERVVTGVELERMSDDELACAVDDIRIYARVDPEHKLRIVNALKRRGHVVAMTGDGVNDAPALKRADIGVAMGRIGTDVSREAADMVLADDNFATIVEAIRQGRIVFENLRKVILFLLSCNMSEVLIVFTTALISPHPALLPLQILWINLVTDGPPALALGVDRGSPRVMDRAPRGPEESILTPDRQMQILVQGALMTLAGLIIYFGAGRLFPVDGPEHAQTMLFTAMVLVQGLHAFSFLSASKTVFSRESLRNGWLIGGFGVSLVLQAAVIYLPPLRRLFGTVPLGVHDWIAVVAAVLVPVVAIDALKVLGAIRARRA